MSFVPTDLSGCIAHWDAGLIDGLADGDQIASLPEHEGRAALVPQGATAPTFQSNSGLPYIQFNGTSHWLLAPSVYAIESMVLTNVIVMRIAAHKNYNTMFAWSSATGIPVNAGSEVLTFCFSGGNTRLRDTTAYVECPSVPAAADAMLTGSLSYHSPRLLLNGKAGVTSGTANHSNIATGSYYPAFGTCNLVSSFFSGRLYEWIAFEQTSFQESFYVEGYLANKYGLTLPTQHPFFAAPPSAPPSGASIPRILSPYLIGDVG